MSSASLTTGIDHVGLTVKDLGLTSAFFIDCLGWKKIGEKPDYPAVFVSDGHIMLHHLAIRAADESAFNEIFERVSKWPGVKVEFSPELLGKGPKRHMMIYEPSGIRIEFDLNPPK
jgi:catechol-2,3-dioxygenase